MLIVWFKRSDEAATGNVASVHVRGVNGFVLATQTVRDGARQTSQHEVSGVYHEPVALDFVRLGRKSLHVINRNRWKNERGGFYVNLQRTVKHLSQIAANQSGKYRRAQPVVVQKSLEASGPLAALDKRVVIKSHSARAQ